MGLGGRDRGRPGRGRTARPQQGTFADEQADLRVDELLHAVTLAGHQPQDGQEGLDVAEPPLLVLQLLLLRRLVDAGEHVGLRVTEHVEERLVLGTVP